MKILRVVHEYWPESGGNERWSFLHDRWFSEVAGDDVQVVVLRDFLPFDTDCGNGVETFVEGPFHVPDLPRVKAYQYAFPGSKGLRLLRGFHRLLEPWLRQAPDIIFSQIRNFHAHFCWRNRPVVFEAPWLLSCNYGYQRPDCRRNALGCRECFLEQGVRWWLRDQLRLASYRRFDLIVGNSQIVEDLGRAGLEAKGYTLRHIVEPEAMHQAPDTVLGRMQKRTVDGLAERYPFLLVQFNRLEVFKDPHFLLDIAQELPECAVVFAGDGNLRPSLEERINESADLKERVAILRKVEPKQLGSIAAHASAFVMTSPHSNHNTSLFETLGLGIAPVVAVDTEDFPAEVHEGVLAKVPREAKAAAAAIRQLLLDRKRAEAMVRAARTHVLREHSADQLWAYRQRLLELVARYKTAAAPRISRDAPARTEMPVA